jgi:tetratricopeptide (TPR) repeat protein
MQVKRDYSQPFFSNRRRRRVGGRFLFAYGLFLGAIIIFLYTQFDKVQLAALDALGIAPTATPYASTFATDGAALFLDGKLEEATLAFESAARQRPENVDYLYEYGRLLIETDRSAEVLAPVDFTNSDLSLADRIIELAPNDPRGYALKTKALVWTGQSTDAIPVGVSGMEVDPNFAPLRAALARAYTNIGRYGQGLEYAAEAVAIDPLDVDSHRSYAYALAWVGQRQRAIEQLEDAIAINPKLIPAYFELAVQYLALNMEAEAVATYERILSMEPRNARANLRLCETYARIGQQDRAEGYCSDALDIDPNYAEAWRQVGMARYNRRNYEGAIEAFETCVANGSSEIQCWYIRGLAHYYLGQCEQAWTILEESLPMAEQLAEPGPIIQTIRDGLWLTTRSCTNYAGRELPTVPPPTAIPPTPIGGF